MEVCILLTERNEDMAQVLLHIFLITEFIKELDKQTGRTFFNQCV